MPTGYTAYVADGKITEFADFAMLCARAFGALIEMRDDPLDAPIPETIEPRTTYYDETLAASRARLSELLVMTDAIAAEAAKKAEVGARADHDEYEANRAAKRGRYADMLGMAQAWEPPTEDHVGLKDFMVQQLADSIRSDCWESEPFDASPYEPKRWLADEIARAQRDIAYSEQKREEAIKRAADRTEWVRTLRASLVGETDPA